MIPIFRIFEGLFNIPKGPKCVECKSVLSNSNCPNTDCPMEVASWVMQWASPEAANIPILNEFLALKLARRNLIIHPADLYKLTESDWQQLLGNDEIKLKKLMQYIESSKKMTPESLVYGFRIKGVDYLVAKDLMTKFSTISKLRVMKIEELITVASLSKETAFIIRQWFRDSFNKRMLKILDAEGFNLD